MTARPARRPVRVLAAALVVLAATAACDGERGAGEGLSDTTDVAVGVAPGSAGIAEVPGGGPGPAAADTVSRAGPPARGAEDEAAESLPPLPGEEPLAEPVTYRLLLVNANADSVVVHASAGAGRVVLDTVPGRDSVRVDVRLRSDRIQLEAGAPDGEPLGAMELLLEADSLNRWELPSVARGVVSRGRPGRPPTWGPGA